MIQRGQRSIALKVRIEIGHSESRAEKWHFDPVLNAEQRATIPDVISRGELARSAARARARDSSARLYDTPDAER